MSASLETEDRFAAAPGRESEHGADRPLSVAEVQQALRELRARTRGIPDAAGGDTAVHAPATGGDMGMPPPLVRGDVASPPGFCFSVLAAHAGAGASTVALALSEAAASTGRSVHLIDGAAPGRSGLICAASAELGLDATGTWRRGTRSAVTLDRRAVNTVPKSWPASPKGPARVTVLDLGLGHDTAIGAPDSGPTVVVCRLTVPAVRMLERWLHELAERPVAVAAVGRGRWPAEVTASIGPRLRGLRSGGRVVPVPLDGRVAVRGLDAQPLPKSLVAAGLAMFQLLAGENPSVAPTSHRAPTSARADR